MDIKVKLSVQSVVKAQNDALAALNEAKRLYQATLNLDTNKEYTLSEVQALLGGSIETAEPQEQHTPKSPLAYYSFPSKTESGKYHEVVIGRDKTTCNCEAGRFGRRCWAVKALDAVPRYLGAHFPVMPGEGGIRVSAPRIGFGTPESTRSGR